MPSSPLGFSPENYPVRAEDATFPLGFSPENAPVRTEDATFSLGFSPEHSRVCTEDATSGEPAPLTESSSPGSAQALQHAPQSHSPPAFVEQAPAPTDMPTVQRLFPEVVAPMVIEVFAGSARLSQACQAVGFRTLAVDKSTKQSRYAIHCLDLTLADDVQALLDIITLEANNLELVHLAPPCGASSAKPPAQALF